MLEKIKNYKMYKFSTTQLVSLGFLGVILIGTILLSLPISAADGQKTAFIDVLFTAFTSVCVTGLTVVSTADHWSLFGKIIILILVQLGGLGVVACVTMFLLVANQKITLNRRIIIQESYGLDTMDGMGKLIRRIVKGTLTVEGIGAVLYSIHFIPQFGLIPGIWRAVFSSVSVFCNAGMDILGNTSFTEYRGNILINITTMALIIIGGIGFPVWWDVIRVTIETWQKNIKERQFFDKLTLHSKLAIVTTGILILGGFVSIFLLEYNNPLTMKELSLGEKIMSSLFQSVTTRTAGIMTLPQENFTNASAVVSMVLMFIGGAPASTAGGMKVTTIAMIILTTISFAKGRSDTEVFKRKIAPDIVRMGLVVVTLGVMIFLTAVILLSATEDAPLMDVVFEISSALGTTGLSRGFTPYLSEAGKVIVMIVMYIGRIGPITLVVALTNRKNSRDMGIHYPEKRIMIG
ncbi:TrkH family potassium uptake protein [Konateibacter massiliensis]|uniref:TrkH family potassium uptake protein n=1 Tax=Konateibacter massiliensis TaxID=2002841 RepID=UPI001F31ED88|nr:potassium transporter TrkG [Konateibacter massiliensis]